MPAPSARAELVPEFVRRLPAVDDGSLAVFDADGTLWVDDVADDFTRWMIESGAISGEAWPTYMRIYRDDPPTGCRYLLRFFRGLPLERITRLVERWWRDHAHRRWIDEVVATLHHVHQAGYAVWVVSGTPTDFLLPLRRMLPVERVLGMDFELDRHGAITGRHAGIACAGRGKADKLLAEAGRRPIRLCCGNGSLDGPMMELAEVAWSVYPAPSFEAHCRARGWPVLPRPADFVEEEKFLLED